MAQRPERQPVGYHLGRGHQGHPKVTLQRAMQRGGDQKHAEGGAVLLAVHPLQPMGVHQGREDVREVRGRHVAVPQQDRLLQPGGPVHVLEQPARRDTHGAGHCRHHLHRLRHQPLRHVQQHPRGHGLGAGAQLHAARGVRLQLPHDLHHRRPALHHHVRHSAVRGGVWVQRDILISTHKNKPNI